MKEDEIPKTVEHYRARALEVRAIAEKLAESEARRALLEVVEEYERVAKALEAKRLICKDGEA